ncbi:transposable element Tcb1 transposase [Trichonephila clavipes]|nr:transposable element Tcb1 transposase [Trichonephila clavipes]
MSRRKQRSAFDQVSEVDRERIVTYQDYGLSFRKIGSRVGRNQITLMRICDRWIQEVSICLQHHDVRTRVWRHRGERRLNSCVMLRHTGPAPGIMIENMWSMVAQRLTQITPPAATPDQLWQRVEAAWSAVPQERIQSLFESMPRHVAAVISNNNGISSY